MAVARRGGVGDWTRVNSDAPIVPIEKVDERRSLPYAYGFDTAQTAVQPVCEFGSVRLFGVALAAASTQTTRQTHRRRESEGRRQTKPAKKKLFFFFWDSMKIIEQLGR